MQLKALQKELALWKQSSEVANEEATTLSTQLKALEKQAEKDKRQSKADLDEAAEVNIQIYQPLTPLSLIHSLIHSPLTHPSRSVNQSLVHCPLIHPSRSVNHSLTALPLIHSFTHRRER